MTQHEPSRRTTNIGAVSFLNARPLTLGLDDHADIRLTYAVPADLAALLESGGLDVALVPVIDTLRRPKRWPLVTDACIACDGATLTVRVFSRVDPADITVLHVDGDSHTSVALARVLWQERHHRRLDMVRFSHGAAGDDGAAYLDGCQAILLIGDKVIKPPVALDAFSTQVDLGATWKSLTGLPFVFAAWATTGQPPPAFVLAALTEARDKGVARAAEIAAELGPGLGWPADLAVGYLTRHLNFTMTERHREGMKCFFELVEKHIDSRELVLQ